MRALAFPPPPVQAQKDPTSGQRSHAPSDSDATTLPSPRALSLLIYRQMRALAGPHPDLDDLAQAALEQVLRARFKGESKFSTFAHSICYHVWLKHLRWSYSWRSLFHLTGDGETPELGECLHDVMRADERLEAHERCQKLYQVLDLLPPKQRAVVTLREISALEIEEIAQIVDAGEGTVRSRLRDGRKRLSELLKTDPYFMGAGEFFPEESEVNHG